MDCCWQQQHTFCQVLNKVLNLVAMLQLGGASVVQLFHTLLLSACSICSEGDLDGNARIDFDEW